MRTSRCTKGPGAARWVLSLAAASLWLSPPAARAQEEVVKLGDLLALGNVGVYAAVEKGYFKEQGIRNEITTFASSAKALPALTAGELEVAVGGASAGLFNAVAQGAGFRIVADKGQTGPGRGYVYLTVRKDLVEEGQVRTVRDLKGRKVAIFAKGSIQDYLMGKMAEEVGLTLRDFDVTYMAAPQQLAAYQAKAIDAAQVNEPWGANFVAQNVAVRFRTPEQVRGLGAVQIGVIIYSGRFIRERRPTAQRWMTAYLKGCRFYVERGIHDPEVLAILEKYTKVPAKTIEAAIPQHQDPEGRPNVASLADQIQWFVTNGYMPKPVTVEQVVDLSFLH
ncbi:MAG TPA: ABC transporter substrate-binding protein [Candidatus Methylomirabilis sp.]|jgi:NitT/TauT family transport system substrate-binding protein